MTVPYDAETIDGKGLVVYPGFIDLYTTVGQRAGVERSATGKGRPVDLAEAPLSSTPPDNRRGLTPEFEVAVRTRARPTPLAEPRRQARIHRSAFGPGRRDRDRPECARQPERPAAPRGDRRGPRGPARQPAPPSEAAAAARRRLGSPLPAPRRRRADAGPDARARSEPAPPGLFGQEGPAKTRIRAS